MGIEAIDVRLARLEGAYEQLDKRLGTIEDRLVRLETKVDAGFARLDSRIDALGAEMREGFARLDAKIDGQVTRIDARIDTSDAEMRGAFGRVDARIDGLSARMNIMVMGIVAAILAPILLRIFYP